MPLQTITAFARRFAVSRATLLYYHRIGLLAPAGTSPAGYRLYGEAEAARMGRIETFRKAGLPLAEIRAILDEGDTAPNTAPDTLRAALEQRLADLNREIADLHAQRHLIARLLSSDERRTHMDVERWVAMLEEAGVDEEGRRRWHHAFERDAPEAHREFLISLGLRDEEVAEVREKSRTLWP